MAIDACDEQKLLDDMDEDDAPLVFKRPSSSAKLNLANSQPKNSLSQKKDLQTERPTNGQKSYNGQSSPLRKENAVTSSKASPAKSPLSSPKSSNSSGKTLPIKSSEVHPKIFSTSVTEEPQSFKNQIEEKAPFSKVLCETNNSEDSEDDKPLCDRISASSSRGNSIGANKLPKALVGQKPRVLKKENADDVASLSSVFQVKSDVTLSTREVYYSEEIKSILPKPSQNGSTSTDHSQREPSTSLKKRPLNTVKSECQSYEKKPRLSDASTSMKDRLPMPRTEIKKEGEDDDEEEEEVDDDDDDHIPISQKMRNQSHIGKISSVKKVTKFISETNKKLKKVMKGEDDDEEEDDDDEEEEDDDDDDHIPISKKMRNQSHIGKISSVKKVTKSISETNKKSKKVMKNKKDSISSKILLGSGDGQKWTTLAHNSVIFPPPYKPHGIKMLYKGKPVDLTPAQEEVATMFAVMLDTAYMSKPIFRENFMMDWRKILGKNHIIQNLEDCDFTPIYEWHQKEKEKKKQMSGDEKKALKEQKLQQEEKYMWAVVDGVKEKVGNFRVEPPGLFRGRGEHPKMGRLKRRIRPSDIIINIGKDAPIPECPIPGESWKEIRHDNSVTWLAYWPDPINPKEFKYVFLAASSTLKGQSDKEKYEKARLLKNYIQGIRAAYTRDFTSKDLTKNQIAVATYLIDKLALRAGNEKDDDEADTVGCCTLKVENVEPAPPNILKFDFLGKDSIRYQNEVVVETAVYKAIQQFRSRKKGGDLLFDLIDTSKLNAHLKELMPGLTAKVFRTYNASITLDDMLSRETKGGDVSEKVVVYQHANKEVAIICNHQRTVSKSHGAQMLRLDEKIEELKGTLEELKKDLTRSKKGKPAYSDGKTKKNMNPEAQERKIAQTAAKIEKMERDKETKEDLKTVALGTSKLNYLDPRITVAWCKRHEVPIEKIFNKSLLAKFAWAMDVDPEFRF